MIFKFTKNFAITLTILSILSIFYSFYQKLPIILIISIIMFVVSVISMLFTLSIEIFSKEKNLDLEELQRQGMTIVECCNCSKNNVLEDIYCIYCGEKLENSDEKL